MVAQRRGGLAGCVVVDFHVEFHDLVEVKRFHAAYRHAHGVAEIIANVMVLEKEGVLRQDGTLGRVLDVAL